MIAVLAKAYFEHFTTKSNFARKQADTVAMLSNVNFITTHLQHDTWGRVWRITSTGLELLEHLLTKELNDE